MTRSPVVLQRPDLDRPILNLVLLVVDHEQILCVPGRSPSCSFADQHRPCAAEPVLRRMRTNMPGRSNRLLDAVSGLANTPRTVMVPVEALTTLLAKLMYPSCG